MRPDKLERSISKYDSQQLSEKIPKIDFRDADLVMRHESTISRRFNMIGVFSSAAIAVDFTLMTLPQVADGKAPLILELPVFLTSTPAIFGIFGAALYRYG